MLHRVAHSDIPQQHGQFHYLARASATRLVPNYFGKTMIRVTHTDAGKDAGKGDECKHKCELTTADDRVHLPEQSLMLEDHCWSTTTVPITLQCVSLGSSCLHGLRHTLHLLAGIQHLLHTLLGGCMQA